MDVARINAGGIWRELAQDLRVLRGKGLYRQCEVISSQQHAAVRIGHQSLINFSSNNYLGLSTHPRVIRKAVQAAQAWGAGSGASRLLSGSFKVHADLETKLAAFKKEESAAVFSSGYLANLGVMTALLDERDLVLLDRLNHASLVDGARLSKAKLWVYPHKEVAELQRLLGRAKNFRRKLVVTDAYFSMDGDVAPLNSLLEVCEKENAWLLIDEAHSTGVFGDKGRGLTEHFGLSGKIHVVMGTLSKALGSVGGFIAGREVLKETLTNRCREFIYTTAPSPSASAAAIESLKVIEENPGLRKDLWTNIRYLRNHLEELGFSLMGSEGPIVPILIGDTRKAVLFRDFLRKKGIFAPAIRPPTVPKGTDRIRISLTAEHTKEEIKKLLAALKEARDKIR